MMMQFDIESGEPIDEARTTETFTSPARFREAAALRLMTVEEAVAAERRRVRLPADIATLPVTHLLQRWN